MANVRVFGRSTQVMNYVERISPRDRSSMGIPKFIVGPTCSRVGQGETAWSTTTSASAIYTHADRHDRTFRVAGDDMQSGTRGHRDPDT